MTTPWVYLEGLVRMDRGPNHDDQWMTGCLQRRWPGAYKVEKIVDYQWQSVEYAIVFDKPEDETYFRLKYQ